MQTKLTIRIDELLINKGKKWSREHGVSLSTLFSRYLETLERISRKSPPPTPILNRLKGTLKGKRIPGRGKYTDYLEGKHR